MPLIKAQTYRALGMGKAQVMCQGNGVQLDLCGTVGQSLTAQFAHFVLSHTLMLCIIAFNKTC